MTERHQWSKYCQKNGANRLAQHRVTANFQFANNKISVKSRY